MSIPASNIVQINPRVNNPGANALELNALFLTENATIPTEQRVLQFTNPTDVANYFGPTSIEAQMAAKYFLGHDNSFKKPVTLYLGRYLAVDAAPWLRGGAVSSKVGDIKQIINGELSFTLAGYKPTITGIDFSTINSYSDAAAILQTAIRSESGGGTAWTAATVAYNSDFKAFIITGGDAGAGQDITVADTGMLAYTLALVADYGAITSQGADAQRPDENLEACLLYTQNWASFTTCFEPSEDETKIDLAQWATSYGVRFAYVLWSKAANLTVQFDETNIGKQLQALSISSTIGGYGDALLAAFICGTIASVDYSQNQGAITYAFKAQSGQAITVQDEATANTLLDNGFNFYGDYATANDHFIWFYNGQIFGDYAFIDTYINQVWLNNTMQLSLMLLFKNTPRIPYNQTGYTLVRAALQDPINQAKNAGVIDTGVVLSEQQKAQINREAGLDISASLSTDGYYLQIKDPTAQVRAQRGTPVVNLWYTYGGSIHKLEMASTVIL